MLTLARRGIANSPAWSNIVGHATSRKLDSDRDSNGAAMCYDIEWVNVSVLEMLVPSLTF